MKIGFDGSRAFSKNRTGTENYSYQLLKHLAQIDTENEYYVYVRPGVSANQHVGKSADQQNADTLTNRYSDTPEWPANFKFITIPFSRLWTQVGLARQTFKDKDLDILFIPSHTLPFIKRPGLKTVVTVHDLGAEYLPKTHQLKQRLYLKFMTDHQLKTATHLIAVSNATKKDLVKKVHINPQKITVVPEGYEKSVFRILKNDEFSDILTQYGIERDKYFIFVGTIQPRKNLIRLISAYSFFLKSNFTPNNKQLGDVSSIKYYGNNCEEKPLIHNTYPIPPTLVLTGSKGWLSDEIYELPKKLGIEKYVKFIGYVPDENLPALYNGAIALLFPSLFEGFGLPVLEAMACGCPVLTSNVSSLPEVAGNAALLVNPLDEKEIAQGITRLFEDQKLRDKLKNMGIAQSSKFSWEKCARETLKVLTSVK